MKKIMMSAAVLLLPILAAYGGAKTDASAAAGTGPVTVKFANYALLEAGYTEFWEGVKAGFEKKYPHITIEWITAPYGEITNQVINMAGGGDKVDLLFGEISWIPTLEDAGLSVPVDTVLSPSYLADFYPNILDGHKVNGKIYGVPLYISPFVLYYNKDIFKKAGLNPDRPPGTYDEMLAAAEKIAPLKSDDGNKIYPFGQTTASVPISGSSLTAMVYNFGGKVIEDNGKLSVDNAGFRQAFETLQRLQRLGWNPENAKLKDLRNLFALGQLAMYYDQSWGFNGIQSINPNAGSFTASAPPLSGGVGAGNSILQSHCFILMDNGPARREALRLLVEYVITEEVLGDYMSRITPAYPAKKSMSGMTAITQNNVLKGAAGSINKSLPVPFIPALGDLNLELCTLAQAVTVGGTDLNTALSRFKNAAAAFAP
jgi:multiple sugar transport system substrate-binding protein